MQYRTLGRTGLKVSEIGHGMWGMGDWSGAEQNECEQALKLSLENGCNFYDTAWAYGQGASDKLLGWIIANQPRKEIVAASKVPPKNWKWPGSSENKLSEVYPINYVLETAEKINNCIGKKPIELLQYHVWDDSWANESEFKETVAALKEKGLIKYFGLSLNRWEPENGIEAIETGVVDTVQVIYNIFDQAPDDKLFPLCEKMNIGVIARVPLDEGSLGGKMTLQTRFPDSDWRAKYFGPENLPETIERVEAIKKIVPREMSLPELALRFILENKAVSTVIVGMRNENHTLNNLKSSDGNKLPIELFKELKKHRWDRAVTPWAN